MHPLALPGSPAQCAAAVCWARAPPTEPQPPQPPQPPPQLRPPPLASLRASRSRRPARPQPLKPDDELPEAPAVGQQLHRQPAQWLHDRPAAARAPAAPAATLGGGFGLVGDPGRLAGPERRPQPAPAPAPQPAPQPAAAPSVGSSFFSSLSQAVKQTAASAGLVDAPAPAPAPAAARKAKVLLVVDEPHTDWTVVIIPLPCLDHSGKNFDQIFVNLLES
ncbi:uncharacterized protein LOC144373988 [Ictidomys tridecemlineatus]